MGIKQIKNFVLDPSLFGYLHCVHEDHVDMVKLYDKVERIIEANQPGPRTYLYPIYEYYFPLLGNKIMAMTENIFTKSTIPSLPVRLKRLIYTKLFDHRSILLLLRIEDSRRNILECELPHVF